MTRIHWLAPTDPPDSFPDPAQALGDPEGLLAVGGDLSVERLLHAYQHGIFPWYQDEQPILWWSPNPRAVLFPNDLHISRSLRRTLRRNAFSVSIDNAFDAVIRACADEREVTGTWITDDMDAAYRTLHRAGHAHAVETWENGELIGGLYGVNIGRVFFGESMFSRTSDASKVALVRLVILCQTVGIELIDCQLPSAHLASLGSREIPRQTFLKLVDRYTRFPSPSPWRRAPEPTANLPVT